MMIVVCPCCGASLEPLRLPDRTVLLCQAEACGHYEPLPATLEVKAAGGQTLPGLEEA